MKFLAERSLKKELMDDLSVGYDEFEETLVQLELLNQITGAYAPTLEAIRFFHKKYHQKSQQPLRILDIGCGYGDTLRKIYQWAQSQEIKVELTGIDLNPWSKKAADFATAKGTKIRFITEDIFKHKVARPYHIIINSLLTHHLTEDELIKMIQWMTRHARYGWFINDLHRHAAPYFFIKYFVKVLRFNRLIKNDAPLSVARAFIARDWQNLSKRASLDTQKLKIRWYWPFRWGVRYEVG